MIDRTQLTEALVHGEDIDNDDAGLIMEAARLLLDFPTDEQVEAMARRRTDGATPDQIWMDMCRKDLEAVRDTMIGES